jgi:hypothetical protein
MSDHGWHKQMALLVVWPVSAARTLHVDAQRCRLQECEAFLVECRPDRLHYAAVLHRPDSCGGGTSGVRRRQTTPRSMPASSLLHTHQQQAGLVLPWAAWAGERRQGQAKPKSAQGRTKHGEGRGGDSRGVYVKKLRGLGEQSEGRSRVRSHPSARRCCGRRAPPDDRHVHAGAAGQLLEEGDSCPTGAEDDDAGLDGVHRLARGCKGWGLLLQGVRGHPHRPRSHMAARGASHGVLATPCAQPGAQRRRGHCERHREGEAPR